MKRTAFFNHDANSIMNVYADGRREKVAAISDLLPEIVTPENFVEHSNALASVEAIFSTWGMMKLTEEQLDAMPALRAVFYGAGSVKAFADPLLDRGITVVGAWGANAVPVAEHTVAQIVLANKGYFHNVRKCATPETRPEAKGGIGNFGETVALLGAGQIGKTVTRMLQSYCLEVIIWDPFLEQAVAAEIGAEKVDDINDAFRRGRVVSNHLANVPETEGLITAEQFELMRPDAAFINTARGATVVEADLVEVFSRRLDLTALLDVTDPEPPTADSDLYGLANIHITSHISGALGSEIVRMADFMIDEFLAWEQGNPLRYEITAEMLPRLA